MMEITKFWLITSRERGFMDEIRMPIDQLVKGVASRAPMYGMLGGGITALGYGMIYGISHIIELTKSIPINL